MTDTTKQGKIVRFVISLKEGAEDEPERYSIREDLAKISGIGVVGVGYAGLSAIVDAPIQLHGTIARALPYAYVDVDKQANLL